MSSLEMRAKKPASWEGSRFPFFLETWEYDSDRWLPGNWLRHSGELHFLVRPRQEKKQTEEGRKRPKYVEIHWSATG